MSISDLSNDDALEDFTPRMMSVDGIEKKVWGMGTGPAVIVMTEMPGISPHVARFARWVRDAGFSVYMPSLFRRDGAVLRSRVSSQHCRKCGIDLGSRRMMTSSYFHIRPTHGGQSRQTGV